jgi:adenylate kinase
VNSQRDLFIFIGPPGSGKGSLSQLCVKRLGWQQFSTGNLCREHILRGTDIGKQIDFAIKSGKLISDSLIVELAHGWLGGVFVDAKTVVFDGFPRTVAQARALQTLLEDQYEKVRLNLVRFAISDEEIVYRLLARSICQNEKCQRVYSLHKHSPLQPVKSSTCNECESPLMRRSDDEESAIKERLRIYHEHEKELLHFYQAEGHDISNIHADMPLESVYEKLIETMGNPGI